MKRTPLLALIFGLLPFLPSGLGAQEASSRQVWVYTRPDAPQGTPIMSNKATSRLAPFRSETLRHHPTGWPSDPASVLTSFYFKE